MIERCHTWCWHEAEHFGSLSYKRNELWIHRPIHIDQCYVNSTAGGTPRPVRNRLKSTTVKHAVRNDWSSYRYNCNYRPIWIFPIRFYTILSKRCRVWYSNLWQSYSSSLLVWSVVNFRSFGRSEYTRDFTPYDDSHRLIFQRSSFYGSHLLVSRRPIIILFEFISSMKHNFEYPLNPNSALSVAWNNRHT